MVTHLRDKISFLKNVTPWVFFNLTVQIVADYEVDFLGGQILHHWIEFGVVDQHENHFDENGEEL